MLCFSYCDRAGPAGGLEIVKFIQIGDVTAILKEYTVDWKNKLYKSKLTVLQAPTTVRNTLQNLAYFCLFLKIFIFRRKNQQTIFSNRNVALCLFVEENDPISNEARAAITFWALPAPY